MDSDLYTWKKCIWFDCFLHLNNCCSCLRNGIHAPFKEMCYSFIRRCSRSSSAEKVLVCKVAYCISFSSQLWMKWQVCKNVPATRHKTFSKNCNIPTLSTV